MRLPWHKIFFKSTERIANQQFKFHPPRLRGKNSWEKACPLLEAWQSEKSAEDMIAEIGEDRRNFHRIVIL
jgi:hypothetical protein